MKGIWERVEALGLNTVLLPATWELVEPVEGRFDFKTQDEIIYEVRNRGKHIIFLWFGSWKNAQCMYAPEWVKKDIERFPRAQVIHGKNKCVLESFYGMPYTTLSYLGEETKKADAKAFAAFMRHLKEIDGDTQTVIAVQVENETGLQGAGREHSDAANEAFAKGVPEELVSYMRSHMEEMEPDVKAAVEAGAESGRWGEVFGGVAEEVFSAYYIASFVNYVAEAGRAEYDLPMTANCWLDKGEQPGDYPSGGPVARMMEVWKFAAPAIDVIAPDIYVQNFIEICDQYRKMGNPLFIPETATHSHVGPRLVYTVGHHHAMCFAPFGFEDLGGEFDGAASFLFGVDTSDPLLTTPQSVEEYRWYNETLSDLMPRLTDAYNTNRLQATISEDTENNTMIFDQFGIISMYTLPIPMRKDGVCLALQESEDTFYVIASGCMLAYVSTDPTQPNVDIIALEEGYLENGEWVMTRRLNGDEATIANYSKPTLLKVKLMKYE